MADDVRRKYYKQKKQLFETRNIDLKLHKKCLQSFIGEFHSVERMEICVLKNIEK